jgi:hypothetical protein
VVAVSVARRFGFRRSFSRAVALRFPLRIVNAAWIGGGLAVVVITLNDVFQSVIVPRAVASFLRPGYYLRHGLWWIWPWLAWQLYPSNARRREDTFATFAPFALVLTLAFWALLLTLGYGAMLWGMRASIHPVPATFWEAAYFSGTSFFTIGFGDFVGGSGWPRLISLAAGASGLLVVSITTAFLFAVFGAFQQREQFVVTIGARAGSPPNGVGLLVVAARKGLRDSLPDVMRAGQRWCASVMETHLAYPTLAYFRSSHDDQSWVGTLGTLLDAATLMMTTIQCEAGEAHILYEIGRHCARDLARNLNLPNVTGNPGVAREEFERACDKLALVGYTVHDRDNAWEAFSLARATYAQQLTALAQFFSIPPLEWIGDRSLIRDTAHR